MNITSNDVKKLREQTGAGIMDCKRALTESQGNFTKAERLLKERGMVAAAARKERITNEGRIACSLNQNKAVLIELACETDFAARNEKFIQLSQQIADIIASSKNYKNELEEKILSAVSIIKENITLRRSATLNLADQDIVEGYIHGEEGRAGCIVAISCTPKTTLENKQIHAFLHDLALHITAFRPKFLRPEDVPMSYIQEQKEIFTKQTESLNKAPQIIQNIVEGKLKKHFKEICCTEQAFVKDEKNSVQSILQTLAKNTHTTLRIVGYKVFLAGDDDVC